METAVASIAAPSAESEYELERGKPMPSRNHGRIELKLGALLYNRYDRQFTIVTEATLSLPEKDATPDLAIYPKRADDWQNDELKITEMPLLVVEILSASQRLSEAEEKVMRYHRAGIKTAWLVLPSLRAIVVYRAGQLPKVIASGEVRDEYTGIAITIEELFNA